MLRTLVLCGLAATILPARVLTGLEVMAADDFQALDGKKVGVLANANSIIHDGRNIVTLLAASKHAKLAAIFAPEHGFRATSQAGANISSGKDPVTGVPIYSLYEGNSHRPKPEALRGLDALVFDLPDVGARFWTFTSHLSYLMEAAAAQKIPLYVLDRPNPINGIAVEGPLLDAKYISMIGVGRRPIRHGMTMGELAGFFNGENHIGADLHVVKMQGWQRSMWMDETGLEWTNPSPNLRSLTAAILYPGTCMLENMQVSVGRGTDTPFVMVGAPWFRGNEVADYLNGRNIPGVRFLSRHFTPSEQPYKGQECFGLDVQLIDRNKFDSARLGLELASAALKFHPGKYTLDRKIMLLLGSDKTAAMLQKGVSPEEIEAALRPDLDEFRKVRQKYLLY